jgi:predicted CXXCH cytochrome family protein
MTRAFGGYVPYHNGDTLICSDCHTMHASAEHGYAGQAADFPPVSGPSGPMLLKRVDPIDLCLACHDGMPGIPDVLGDDINGLAERSAGLFADPDVLSFRGHNLGRGLPMGSAHLQQLCFRCHFGGQMATATVTCVDCHNPHGNNRVRNLQWASDPGGEPEFVLLMRPGVTDLQKYERTNVAYGYVGATAREVSNMCIDCHHSFFDDASHVYTKPGGMVHWGRHPNFNSEWGAFTNISQGSATGSTDPAHWLAGIGSGFGATARVPFVAAGAASFDAATIVDPATNGVFCLSCHNAHGSAHPFGLRWDTTEGLGPPGCDQCHGVSGD